MFVNILVADQFAIGQQTFERSETMSIVMCSLLFVANMFYLLVYVIFCQKKKKYVREWC